MIKFITKTNLVLILANLSWASIAYVPGDYDNIQSALDNFVWQDTLLVSPGVYEENLVLNSSVQNLVVGSMFIITGDTLDIYQTSINGGGTGRVVTFEWGVDSTVIFAGFTIAGGQGGISCLGETNPVLSDLIITGNSTSNENGGGILLYGRATLTNVVIEDNTSSGSGGGIYLGGNVTLDNVIVRGNTAVGTGGGIYCSWNSSWTGGSSTENLIIENNDAREGGGLYFWEVAHNQTPRNFANFTATNNTANNDAGWGALGGGVFISHSYVTLNNASITGNEAVWSGGGVYISYDSDVEISNANIAGNSANEGGGIYCWDESSLHLSDNVVVSENSASSGGGIHCYGSVGGVELVIRNSTVASNSVDTTQYWHDGGGGIFLRDNVVAVLENVLIDGNSSVQDGGGIFCMNAEMQLSDVIISNNLAVDESDEWSSYGGGGIYSINSSQLWLNSVEFNGNYASYGGGALHSWSSSIYMTNSMVLNNIAGVENAWGNGAGLLIANSSGLLSGITISNNTFVGSGRGGGLDMSGDMSLQNSIVWDNGGLENVASALPSSIVYSDVEGGEAGVYGGVDWLEGNIDADPLFMDSANDNYQLQSGSPCIDAGNPDVVYLDNDESLADMGAYSGNGLAANFNSHDFGTVDVREQTIDWKLYNFREEAIILDSASFSHPDFSLIDQSSIFPLTVEPFSYASFTIQFDPTTGDSITAELLLWSANFLGDAPSTIELSGVGYLPFTAEFEADITSGEAPLTVHFIDQSQGDSLSWAWDFDNNGSIDSEQQNPQWVYQTSGVYSVTLAITNSLGTDAITKTDYIEVFPSNSPMITSISDVPEDQGGWVFVSWSASALDDSAGISYYQVWGHDDSQEDWDILATVPAIQTDEYTFLAPTNGDSTDNGIFWSRFMISAHPPAITILYESEIDSGYSVDNIYPGVPMGPMAVFNEEGQIYLTWNTVTDDDLSHYKIYRDLTSGFVPDSQSMIGESNTTTFIDVDVSLDETYFYQISAQDIHGNEGGFSEEISVTTVSIINEILPDDFVLDQNFPNPFNPTTTISFGLPETSDLSLNIYDVQGNLIKTLFSGAKSAGWYQYNWDGTNDAGQVVATGLYLSRLNAGHDTEVIKMLFLK